MTEISQHSFVNIALVQARESVLDYFRPVLSTAGITEQQWRIINLLSSSGTMDFQDLSIQTSILRPSLTGVLTRLEKLGLVMRLKPASDQRRVFVKLTKDGFQLFEQISANMNAAYEKLEQDFTPKKLATLQTLLIELGQLGEQHTAETTPAQSAKVKKAKIMKP